MTCPIGGRPSSEGGRLQWSRGRRRGQIGQLHTTKDPSEPTLQGDGLQKETGRGRKEWVWSLTPELSLVPKLLSSGNLGKSNSSCVSFLMEMIHRDNNSLSLGCCVINWVTIQWRPRTMPGTQLTQCFSATTAFNKGLFRPVLLAQKYMVMSLEKHHCRWIPCCGSEGKRGWRERTYQDELGEKGSGWNYFEKTASSVVYLFKARWYKGMTLGNSMEKV